MHHANACTKRAHKRGDTKGTSQLPSPKDYGYLLRRPEPLCEAAHVAEGLEDAREFADMAAIDSYAADAALWEHERMVDEVFACDPYASVYTLEEHYAHEGLPWRAASKAAYADVHAYHRREDRLLAERMDRRLAYALVVQVPEEPEHDYEALMSAPVEVRPSMALLR